MGGIDTPQLKKRRVSVSDNAKNDAPAPTSPLLVKRLSNKAKIPTRGSSLAAGYDLSSAEKKVIPAHGKALVDTQLSIAVPAGTYGRVAPRSGLASKFMIDTGAGVIDADYRGVVFVLLFNLSDKDFQVEEGDRIAQLIIERIYTPEVMEVDNLDETLRGAGGFGSTGGHWLAVTYHTYYVPMQSHDRKALILLRRDR
ncbi:dUTP pyrophosphatase [Suillus lakei]|nr:dUTP pyrophosphatase [Suillus lakei]